MSNFNLDDVYVGDTVVMGADRSIVRRVESNGDIFLCYGGVIGVDDIDDLILTGEKED